MRVIEASANEIRKVLAELPFLEILGTNVMDATNYCQITYLMRVHKEREWYPVMRDILRAKQTPNIEVIGVEVHDPNGPHGAKGVGEIGLVPTAGAVANALYQFDRIRRYRLPIKDVKAL